MDIKLQNMLANLFLLWTTVQNDSLEIFAQFLNCILNFLCFSRIEIT
jgi:hypothetical protein